MFQSIQTPKPYSDYLSLKKHVEARYGSAKVNLINTIRGQTGTAGAVDLSEKAGATISNIGKVPIAIKLTGSADDATYLNKLFTLIYNDIYGTSHTAVATGTSTLNATPVAFSPAIADFYEATSFTSNVAVVAGQTITAITSGGAVVWAQLDAAETTATEENMFGVGALYGRTEANHNDGDGAILTLDYITPWGLVVEGATCTIDTTDGTTEIRFYKADGTTTVKDFYRVRKCTTNQIGTANTHAFILTDAACSNVDGSGGDVYGVIEEGLWASIHTNYMVPAATTHKAWFGRIKGTNGTAAITLVITLTPKDFGGSMTLTYVIPYPTMFDIELPIQDELEPLSEVSMTILGNTAVFNASLTMVEAAIA